MRLPAERGGAKLIRKGPSPCLAPSWVLINFASNKGLSCCQGHIIEPNALNIIYLLLLYHSLYTNSTRLRLTITEGSRNILNVTLVRNIQQTELLLRFISHWHNKFIFIYIDSLFLITPCRTNTHTHTHTPRLGEVLHPSPPPPPLGAHTPHHTQLGAVHLNGPETASSAVAHPTPPHHQHQHPAVQHPDRTGCTPLSLSQFHLH